MSTYNPPTNPFSFKYFVVRGPRGSSLWYSGVPEDAITRYLANNGLDESARPFCCALTEAAVVSDDVLRDEWVRA